MTFNFGNVKGQLGGDIIMFRENTLFIATAQEQIEVCVCVCDGVIVFHIWTN